MILDIIYLLIIVVIGLSIPGLVLKRGDKNNRKLLNYLLAFHLFFGVVFFFYTTDGGGDAWGYWRYSQNMSSENFSRFMFEYKGTYFMYALNYIPANILSMSFFSNTMLYSLLGYIGIVLFYAAALQLIPFNAKFRGYFLFPWTLFMPNLHFWSSGVGKDTILFLCIAMFIYGMLNIPKRFLLIAISILLSYLLRPHITLFLFVGYAMAFLFDAKAAVYKRVILSIILISAVIIILPTVMEFAKIEEASVDSFNQFSDNKAAALSNSHTGSAVDISSYPFPLKVATFLYRPFFFDARGIPALMASFENLILLILTYQVFRWNFFRAFKASPLTVKALFFFLCIGTLAFSQSLGNLGIMIRMRNMFLPGMMIYIMWSFSYRVQLKHNLLVKKKSILI